MQLCMGEESAARAADFFHIAGVLVDVGVHGHRNFGMSGNALQGFDVYATCGLQLGQECVAKHMRGYAFGKQKPCLLIFFAALEEVVASRVILLKMTSCLLGTHFPNPVNAAWALRLWVRCCIVCRQ